MFNFRTDLADERRDLYKKANSIENEVNGIETQIENVNEKIKITRVKIINEEGEKSIGKPKGDYITIDIKKIKITKLMLLREFVLNLQKCKIIDKTYLIKVV